MIQEFAETMKEYGVKPECEVFEKGMIDTAILMHKKGLIDAPMHFNFVLGVPGAMTATPRDLAFMVGSIPPGSTWVATGIGKSEFTLAMCAISMGGNVRVGFEDNLYLEKGVLAKSNGELVAKVVEMAKLVGREIATPAEAREIMGLKK